MAGLRPSPKSFPRAWWRAGIASRFIAASGIRSRAYRGVSLVYLPTWRHKYFDTIVHTFFSTLHLIFHRADVALYCNGANAIFTLPPRLFGIPTLLNVDGLERKRKKWNRLAKAWYAISEWLATFCPTVVITDARQIEAYYLERYGKRTQFIPYGAETGKVATAEVLAKLGLERGGYFLYVSRMEPENNALLVREAFEQVDTPMKLALIGDAPYAQEYIERVRDTRDAAGGDAGSDLRRRVSRAALALPGLHPCHRSGRHASGAD